MPPFWLYRFSSDKDNPKKKKFSVKQAVKMLDELDDESFHDSDDDRDSEYEMSDHGSVDEDQDRDSDATGQHIVRRSGSIVVLKWKDKRDIMMLSITMRVVLWTVGKETDVASL